MNKSRKDQKPGGFKNKTGAKKTSSIKKSPRFSSDRENPSDGSPSIRKKKAYPKQSTKSPSAAPDYNLSKAKSAEKFAKPKPGEQPEKINDDLIRLNKFISNAGVCSRREADKLIEAGEISVNGKVITELGYKVLKGDTVKHNNKVLKREKMVYVLLNKPKDFITTTDDPQDRRTVMDLVAKATNERIYPIGRLDRNTTGLLLLTNDGNLSEKLSHPRNRVSKLYYVELDKNLTQGDLNKIAFGLELEDGLVKPDDVSYVQGSSKREVGIQIHSGKNRIVRRIFEHLGYDVIKLDRVVYANLTKKDLPRGHWRYLEEREIIQLKNMIK